MCNRDRFNNHVSIIPLNTTMQELRPKGDADDVLGASRILVSKNWRLPPRVSTVSTTRRAEKKKKREGQSSHKQQQNREAQRAYRERRANRLKEMEESIEALQRLVGHWKGKCADKDKEIARLKAGQSEVQVVGPGIPPANVEDTEPTNVEDTQPAEESPGTCGFCNDGTNCVCTELEHAEAEPEVETVAPPPKSSVFSCSGAPDTCSKCSNIEETCIKPAEPEAESQPLEVDFTHLAGRTQSTKVVGKGAVPWSSASVRR